MDSSQKYINRLNSKGTNSIDSLMQKSKYLFNKQFMSSPSFAVVKVNGIDVDSIITSGKDTKMNIGFRPDYKTDVGSIVEFKNSSYLLISVEDNEISPSGEIQLCNSTYPIKTNKTRVLKTDAQGKPVLDKFGDPVYIYTDGATTSLPCIVESSIITADENKQLPLPQGQLRVTLSYRDDIKVNDTFSMYNNTYKIRNIDYTKVINAKGIMVLSVEQVQSEVQ